MRADAEDRQTQRAKTGTIKGTVNYQADKSRPWRFARYYVKDSTTGFLAEAVVGIKDRKLKSESAPPKTVTVDQINFMFTPETVAIRQGDSVRFTNSDGAIHSVKTSDPFNAFNTTVSNGDEFIHQFQKGINFQPAVIECAFHGAMRAWVFVFNHPYFEVTTPDGRFELRDIPAGTYELRMVHPAGQLVWKKSVTVTAGAITNVAIEVSPDDRVE